MDDRRMKILLEIGCNHQGKISIAKKMIDEAKKTLPRLKVEIRKEVITSTIHKRRLT